MPEIKLSSGFTVKVRTVPPYTFAQISAQFKEPIPPKMPIKSVAGHTEMVVAPDDSPEWLTFVQAQDEYKKKVAEARDNFVYDYGIESWRNGAGEWQTDPPDDWEFPKIFEKYGIKSGGDRRLDYIHYHLIATNDDVGKILDAALGNVAPITDAEVDAALGGFPADAKSRTYPRGAAKRHKGR